MKTINLLTIIILLVFSSCSETLLTDNDIILSKTQVKEFPNHWSYKFKRNYSDWVLPIEYFTDRNLNVGDNILGQQQLIKIDLPEEYNLTSHNPNKPDTMISWISNDTLFIRFKH